MILDRRGTIAVSKPAEKSHKRFARTSPHALASSLLISLRVFWQFSTDFLQLTRWPTLAKMLARTCHQLCSSIHCNRSNVKSGQIIKMTSFIAMHCMLLFNVNDEEHCSDSDHKMFRTRNKLVAGWTRSPRNIKAKISRGKGSRL